MSAPVVEIRAVTAYNVPIRVFPDRKAALEWWAEESCQFPGATLEEVTTETIVRRRTLRRARIVEAA